MNKGINNNDYAYVDLGLPSGTLWATKNVGASKPSDYGLHFQWGDTVGYTAAQVRTGEGKKKFASDWSDYKWYDTVGKTFTKYTTTGEALNLEDDAAHVHMGGDWHMPSLTQFQELLSNSTNTWTSQDGVNGRLFTSKSDTSKFIFIPAAGFAYDGSVSYVGVVAEVWTSMLNADNVSSGHNLLFNSDDAGLGSSYRYGGFSVRGVVG